MIRSLLVACALTSAVSVSLSAQSPLFVDARRSELPFESTETVDIFAGDVDADGDVDLAVSAVAELFIGGRLQPSRQLRQVAPGRFEDVPFPVPGFGRVLAVVDLDNDGDLDYVLDDATSNVMTLRNDGAGNFSSGAGIPNVPGIHAIVATDVDGDSRVDLVLSGGQTRLFLNQPAGAAVFTAASVGSVPSVAFDLPAVASLDVEGDGDTDLFLGTSTQAVLWLNDGTGRFTDASATALPAGTSGSIRAVLALDFDADGDDDLVLGTLGGVDTVLENQGGVFVDATASRGTAAVTDTIALAASDVDGDGDRDLVAGLVDGERLWLWDATAARFVAAPAGSTPGRPGAVSAVRPTDVDGDGDADLVLGRRQFPLFNRFVGTAGLETEILWNDGSGRFRAPPIDRLPHAHPAPRLVAGDPDGDGDVDVLSGSNELLVNDGYGEFTPQPVAAAPGSLPYDAPAALADIDGDGFDDAVLLDAAGLAVLVWRGPSPAFATRSSVGLTLAPRESLSGLAVFDADADGDLDVWVAVTTSGFPFGAPGLDWLVRNDGGGVLTPVQQFFGTSDQGAIAVGDVDGDGDPDVVGSVAAINDGSGSFTPGAVFGSFGAVSQVAVADLDGDGFDDVLKTTGVDFFGDCDPNIVFWNDGTGTFGRSGTAPFGLLFGTSGGCCTGVGVGDLNADGVDDVVWGNDRQRVAATQVQFGVAGVRTPRLATPVEFPTDRDDTLGILVADFDGDGDDDIVTANRDERSGGVARSRLFVNLTRQLRAPFAARIGRGHELELWTPSASGGLLIAAAARGATPTATSFGVLRLDPVTLISAGSFGPSTPGQPSVLSFPVPNVASLIGTEVHWQALDVTGTPRLTNALRDVLWP